MRNGEDPNGAYRILVRDSSESFAGNGIKFKDPASAKAYGIDLASRWLAVRSIAIVKSDLAPDIRGAFFSESLIEAEAIEIIKY